ncbi:patatin-like phospholipase family protein [Marinihelvus fidelis]|uniref:Patatin-like phospholipase family protein n=1 Tax=Marinihelvus fidelis TaxID=2613842 RepID=A0A5N0TAE2_9GAMM|nr:patatin-like phospholipase family protein [Marinihelvus fidelis]KAA9132033.1 patatin-like phospholipase family protein [Marinihelvus fidelis]
MEQATGVCGLVLPGGGARGAYQVGVLKAIAELYPRPAGPFRVVTGTSAGAINAAVVASHAHEFAAGIERLAAFWGSMHCARIYRTDALTVLGSGLRWAMGLGSGGLLNVAPKALLDNNPLRNFLQSTLQLEGVETAIDQGALDGVAITASGYTRAGAVSFFQARPGIKPWRRHRREGLPARLDVSHLMASAALPMLFPAERLGDEYFGDGGMRMTAPLSPAIHLGAEKILVIATRDERPDPAPTAPTRYPSPAEIGGYLLDTIFMDTLNADLARLGRVNRTLSLVPDTDRQATGLKYIDALVIRPSRDLRDMTAGHAADIPWAVKLMLRSLGGWGRDWRMASYLLFEAPYCQALMDLGYADGMAQQRRIRDFLGPAAD